MLRRSPPFGSDVVEAKGDVMDEFMAPVREFVGPLSRAVVLEPCVRLGLVAWNAFATGRRDEPLVARTRKLIEALDAPDVMQLFETLLERRERQFPEHRWIVADVIVADDLKTMSVTVRYGLPPRGEESLPLPARRGVSARRN